MNALPLWLILAPLGMALVTAFAEKLAPRLRQPLALTGATAYAALALGAVWVLRRQGPLLHDLGGWGAPLGIGLRLDDLSALFFLILAVGQLLTLLFIAPSRRLAPGEVPLFFLLITACAGILAAADLFNLFVFTELAAIASAALIALKRRPENLAASFQYLLLSSLSGMIFLVSIMLVYSATGHLSMTHIAEQIPRMPAPLQAATVAGLVAAFGFKIALVPLHFWQPRAYAAAGSGLAAFLSGVAMKIYLYALLRILWSVLDIRIHTPDLVGILLVGGAVNVIAGHTLALAQNDLKRMLAFSSVAHVGYILMGLGAGSPAGMVAALLHIVNHAMMKPALFWSGRSFCRHAQSADFHRFPGAAQASPIGFIAFFLAALAIVGVPPMGGFASKWLIGLSVYESWGLWPVGVIGLGTLLSMTYYGRVFCYALRPASDGAATPSGRSPVASHLPPALLAIGCLLAGLGIRWLLPWLERAADSAWFGG